jgi:predicted flap endonuclease-1-like 5' DNA nuclease
MKFDFESLSTEPLFYMLMHSGAFVSVLGFIFFVVGLLFGYGTWGRYKRQTRQLLGEAESLKDEIASLKRKVGDHSITSGPAVPMATETIHMPRKEGTTATAAKPAVTAETITTQDVRVPVPPKQDIPSSQPPPQSRANVITAKAPKPAEPPVGATLPAGVQTPDQPPAAPAPAEPATASITLASAELPPPARHASPLAAIIAAPPVKAELAAGVAAPAAPEGLAPAGAIPTLNELLLPALPELELKPDLDPKLGLIYRIRPEKTDDLTALEGISLVLAQRLHDIGIYTYAQIAAWDEDRVKEFSARLAFKDRIYRERWVEQAQKLVANQAAV